MIWQMASQFLRGLSFILIHVYQNTFSLTFGPCCRFYPSCSSYAHEAIKRFGIKRGIWLSVKRLIKCHPFHPGGFDPVEIEPKYRKEE